MTRIPNPRPEAYGDCSCTVGPSTLIELPLASLPLKLVCAVCATACALHQRELSVVDPRAGTLIFRSVRLFTTRPSNLSTRPVIVSSAPPVSLRICS